MRTSKNMENSNNNVQNRVRDLEVYKGKTEISISNIEDDIKAIKDNHLNSIYSKLSCIEKKMYQRPGWFLTALLSILSICITIIVSTIIMK